ncbi:unnamed protein product [Coccothraustes coccothraustes]
MAKGSTVLPTRSPPLAELALGRKKVFPVHLLTQSSWGRGEVGQWPAALQRPAQVRLCCHGGHGDPSSEPVPGAGSARGWLMGVEAGVALDAGFGLGGHWLKRFWG